MKGTEGNSVKVSELVPKHQRSPAHEATFVSFVFSTTKQIRDASWCSWHEGTESGFKAVGWGGSGGWGGAKQLDI